THEGITWLDENRKFHRVTLNDSVTKFDCRTIMDTKKYGPVLFTSLGEFFYNEKKHNWEKLDWIPASLDYDLFHDAEPFDEDKIIYATDSLVMIVDYANQKIVYEQPFIGVTSLCRYSAFELAIGLGQGLVQIVDIRSKRIVKEYPVTSELNKKIINTTVTEVRPAANGSILVGTFSGGLMIIDKAGNVSSYMHDPVNPNSIAANMLWR